MKYLFQFCEKRGEHMNINAVILYSLDIGNFSQTLKSDIAKQGIWKKLKIE